MAELMVGGIRINDDVRNDRHKNAYQLGYGELRGPVLKLINNVNVLNLIKNWLNKIINNYAQPAKIHPTALRGTARHVLSGYRSGIHLDCRIKAAPNSRTPT